MWGLINVGGTSGLLTPSLPKLCGIGATGVVSHDFRSSGSDGVGHG